MTDVPIEQVNLADNSLSFDERIRIRNQLIEKYGTSLRDEEGRFAGQGSGQNNENPELAQLTPM